MPKTSFKSYHPYASFALDAKHFAHADGSPSFRDCWPCIEPTMICSEVEELWRLGKRAFSELPDFKDLQEFDWYYGEYLKSIEFFRKILIEGIPDSESSPPSKGFLFVDQNGEQCTPDFSQSGSTTILDVFWQLHQAGPESGGAFLAHCFLFCCLEEIDDVALMLGFDSASVGHVIAAANALANFESIKSGDESLQKARSTIALTAAIERYKNDPKQAAKRFVEECWKDWIDKPSRYPTQTAFATDVLKKVETNGEGNPIISFDTIVKKWIPLWSKNKK